MFNFNLTILSITLTIPFLLGFVDLIFISSFGLLSFKLFSTKKLGEFKPLTFFLLNVIFFFPKSILLGMKSKKGQFDSKDEFNDFIICSSLLFLGVSFFLFICVLLIG